MFEKNYNNMLVCNNDSDYKSLKFDLLSTSRLRPKWISKFFGDKYWTVLSGKWEQKSLNRIRILRESKRKSVENICVIGSSIWKDFSLRVKFQLLTDSIKPPEGGTIIYFLFKNVKNYYSFHFCVAKQKIEFIKRRFGTWSIIANKEYDFEIQRGYDVTISTNSGFHRCHIDGTNLLEVHDTDISNGCVGIGAKYCEAEFSHVSVLIASK